MRIVDLGVAVCYACLILAVVSQSNPAPAKTDGDHALMQARAYSVAAAYVDTVGLPFLDTAKPQAICDSLHQASNETIVLTGKVGGASCALPNSNFIADASIPLSLPRRSVVIEAYLESA